MVFLLLFLSIGSHSIHETICVFRVIFSNSEKQLTKHSLPWLGLEIMFFYNVLLCYALPCMFLLLFDTYRCMIIMMRFKMTWLEWLKHYFLLKLSWSFANAVFFLVSFHTRFIDTLFLSIVWVSLLSKNTFFIAIK